MVEANLPMADERTRGVHLSDKQVAFAIMAALVFAAGIFLSGVLVGRGVRSAKGAVGEPDAIASSQVVGDAGQADVPLADGSEPFTYPDRLGSNPPAERVRALPAQEIPRPGVELPPDVPAEPVPRAEPERLPESPRPAGAAAAAAPAGRERGDAVEAGSYTVQVAAVRSRTEADAIVRQLKTKGFDARVLAPGARDNPAVFRVRIGSFKDKRAADALAERLLRQEKRYKPWVTR